jgi:diphosphomevalonate decarboxylase
MQWFAQAPANIALIKYMGKTDEENNIPANPSLSFTVDKLSTSVVLEQHYGTKDVWEPLHIPGAIPFSLSEAAQKRFLNHLQRIKNHFDYHENFIVRSNNNFPQSSGLASSASSFAALTKCAALAITELKQQNMPSNEELALLSMKGSGSSCRSFYSPWAMWAKQQVIPISTAWMQLFHQVIIISGEEKGVSSSEAHRRVKSSPNWEERVQHANKNFLALAKALDEGDWGTCREICWQEFQEMHALFATADQPFQYMTHETKEVLDLLQKLWEENGDGPIVTMDAGPNIHLLYRPDQTKLALKIKSDYFLGNYDVL